MRLLAVSRVCYALATFFFAVAALPGTAGAGVAHASAGLLLTVWVLCARRAKDLLLVLRDPLMWSVALTLGLINAAGVSAAALADLTTLAVVSQAVPVYALLLAPVFKEKPRHTDWLAAPVLVTGAIVAAGWSWEGQAAGIMLSVAASFGTALFAHQIGVAGRRHQQVHPGAWVAVAMGISSPALFMLQPNPDFTLRAVAFLTLGGAALGIGNVLSKKAMREVPAARAMLLKPLSSIIGAALGIVFLAQSLSWNLIVGAVIVGAGVLIVNRGHKAEAQERDHS